MKRFKKPIVYLLIFTHLIMITGCMSSYTEYYYEKDWVYKDVDVPYTATEKKPIYKEIPPIFPLPNDRPMLLAILPLSSSTGNIEDGVEIAEEIELLMLQNPKSKTTYKILNRTQLQSILTEKELQGLSTDAIKKNPTIT